MTLSITSNFDAGAIEVLSCERADDIRLRVRKDNRAEFAQWFYFRLTGARGERCVMTFGNASACAFPDGWRDYQAVASYDRVSWFRVPTSYDGSVLTIDHTPEFDSIYYAYFEPYSEERHAAFIGAVQQLPHATLTELGRTVPLSFSSGFTATGLPGVPVAVSGTAFASTGPATVTSNSAVSDVPFASVTR